MPQLSSKITLNDSYRVLELGEKQAKPVNKGWHVHLARPVSGSIEQMPRLKHVYVAHCVLKSISQLLPVKFVGHTHLYSGAAPNMLMTAHVPPFWHTTWFGCAHGFVNSHKKPVNAGMHSHTAVVSDVGTHRPLFKHGFGLQMPT